MDKNTTFSTVTLDTLSELSYKSTSPPRNNTITLDKPSSTKKFIFAVPDKAADTAFKIVRNNNTTQNDFGHFENNESVANMLKSIIFADGSSVTYQILILANETSAAIDLTFS